MKIIECDGQKFLGDVISFLGVSLNLVISDAKYLEYHKHETIST